jgi:hypothetical protein
MKKQISLALLGLALALAATAAASAQGARSLRVHVPFDFEAGGQHMPAGRYSVRRVQMDAERTLLIKSEDGRHAAIVLTTEGEPEPARAFLSFRQYGERYFLAGVSMPAAASLREVPKTGAEKRAAREFDTGAKAPKDAEANAARTVTVVGSVE